MTRAPPPLAPTALPGTGDIERWLAADAAARRNRLNRLRDRLSAADVDAYFGVRPGNSRYLTGFALAQGEEQVAGVSWHFLVSGD